MRWISITFGGVLGDLINKKKLMRWISMLGNKMGVDNYFI